MLTPTQASDLFRRAPDELIDAGPGAGAAAYRTVGSGPDVLFVHGWPVSGATFRQLLPHLADHVTCHIIDLPSAGSSRYDDATTLTVRQHIQTVRRVVDHLGLDSVAAVGHNSGGLIARHALGGDPRLRALGLVNSEPVKPGLRFRSLIASGKAPGATAIFRWAMKHRRVRRSSLVFGDTFVDSSLLDGEFDEFVFQPLNQSPEMAAAAMNVLRSFTMDLTAELADIHPKIDVPVQLVWGDKDPFFPIKHAKEMLSTFPNAELSIIEGAGLMAHEEAPAAVAQALLPTLTGSR